ncbi:MAG: hypothetical protein EPN84_03410 [Legionella sp.]|nr:MAG: hypothetical protein EPN84_03410 [Legionella sp.]
MFKLILRRALFCSLPFLSISTVQAMHPNKDVLATQCRVLAQSVSSLISSQKKEACVDKLILSTYLLSVASEYILDDSDDIAKEELTDAIYNLQYAELLNCKRYIQISHAKFETQKIMDSL